MRPLPATLVLAALAAGLSLALTAAARSARPTAPAGAAQLLELSAAVEDLAAKVLQSTVHVRTDFTQGGERRGGTGTGFVIDAIRGLVVTNHHVVQPPGERGNGPSAIFYRVTLGDGRVCTAELVGTDPRTDVAVLRIPEGFARRQLAWGESDDLRPGTLVMAVGNPLGLVGTTSLGVISGLNRALDLYDTRLAAYEDFLQFDAFIDQGSSGGPLVDMNGQVVGISTAIAPSDPHLARLGQNSWGGISYAVPSRLARKVATDLIAGGKVHRGFLGVKSRDITPEDASLAGLPRPFGTFVTTVSAGTPAVDAGIKVGDILLAVDGHDIFGLASLRARISAYSPGDIVELRLWRSKAEVVVRVELSELDETQG